MLNSFFRSHKTDATHLIMNHVRLGEANLAFVGHSSLDGLVTSLAVLGVWVDDAGVVPVEAIKEFHNCLCL